MAAAAEAAGGCGDEGCGSAAPSAEEEAAAADVSIPARLLRRRVTLCAPSVSVASALLARLLRLTLRRRAGEAARWLLAELLAAPSSPLFLVLRGREFERVDTMATGGGMRACSAAAARCVRDRRFGDAAAARAHSKSRSAACGADRSPPSNRQARDKATTTPNVTAMHARAVRKDLLGENDEDKEC